MSSYVLGLKMITYVGQEIHDTVCTFCNQLSSLSSLSFFSHSLSRGKFSLSLLLSVSFPFCTICSLCHRDAILRNFFVLLLWFEDTLLPRGIFFVYYFLFYSLLDSPLQLGNWVFHEFDRVGDKVWIFTQFALRFRKPQFFFGLNLDLLWICFFIANESRAS